MGWGSVRGGHQLLTIDGETLLPILAKLTGCERRDQPGVYKLPNLPGLELRIGGHKADGAVKQLQSVVPPTPGTDGTPRAWNGVETVAEAPAAFSDALSAIAGYAEDLAVLQNSARPGKRNDTRPGGEPPSAYGAAALDGECDLIAGTGQGHRNIQLNLSAFRVGRLIGSGAIDRDAGYNALFAAGQRCGLVDAEIAQTINGALAAGKGYPRDLAHVGQVGNGHPRENGAAGGGFVGFVGSPGEGPPDFTPPKPLTVELETVPPMVPALLPGTFRAWLTDHAERCCLPIDYAAASAVAALGALAARKLAIRPKRRDDWLCVPNLWGAAVGPPGLLKSEATAEGQRFLRRLEATATERHGEALKQHERDTLIVAAEAKAAKDALEKAAKKKADRDHLEELAEQATRKNSTESSSATRYIVGDATIEKLSELLVDNPGILSARDELTGLLRTMDRDGHENDRAFYLESWNGDGPYFVDRIQRGAYMVPRLSLAIFGTIQPGPLARYIRDATRTGDGQ